MCYIDIRLRIWHCWKLFPPFFSCAVCTYPSGYTQEQIAVSKWRVIWCSGNSQRVVVTRSSLELSSLLFTACKKETFFFIANGCWRFLGNDKLAMLPLIALVLCESLFWDSIMVMKLNLNRKWMLVEIFMGFKLMIRLLRMLSKCAVWRRFLC